MIHLAEIIRKAAAGEASCFFRGFHSIIQIFRHFSQNPPRLIL